MILKAESSQTSSSQSKTWMNGVLALATLGLVSWGLWANLSNIKQASQQIEKDIYTDYVSLTQDIL